MSDILDTRYAGKMMRKIWSGDRKYLGWRDVWIAGAEAQMELGLNVTEAQIEELRNHRDDIDYELAARIERETKHDVVAHARAYAQQCPEGGKVVHQGFTSDNLTSTAEAIQARKALYLTIMETAATIHMLGEKAAEYRDLPCAGYTHFKHAQPTTIGKRITMWGYAFALALDTLENIYKSPRWGGIRGATGTEEPLMKLFRGDEGKVDEFQRLVGKKLGLGETYLVIGQTPPRLADYQVLAALAEIGISSQKFGTDIRALWHTRQVGEPFEEGQTGSSAMAYKQNPNRSERMISLSRQLYAHANSAAHMAGQQLLERGLDDSAERRIILPDSFLCADSILQLAMFVADGMRVYPARVERELADHLPFAATENIIVSATEKGKSRAVVHQVVVDNSQLILGKLMDDPDATNDLIERLIDDDRVGITRDEMNDILGDGREYVGRAPQQVDAYLKSVVEPIRERYPDALKLKSEVQI